MGHRKMHAVPGQAVVHGEHHAAGPVHELPGHLVSLAHVEVAAGKASAVQPDQAGHTAVGHTAVEPCRAGGPRRTRPGARTRRRPAPALRRWGPAPPRTGRERREPNRAGARR